MCPGGTEADIVKTSANKALARVSRVVASFFGVCVGGWVTVPTSDTGTVEQDRAETDTEKHVTATRHHSTGGARLTDGRR